MGLIKKRRRAQLMDAYVLGSGEVQASNSRRAERSATNPGICALGALYTTT
jgi:hypothetical protein